jgi:hypothetical protein
MKIRYLHQDKDRHGVVRYYFRRNVAGSGVVKIRLHAKPGTEKFAREFKDAMLKTVAGERIRHVSRKNPAAEMSIAPTIDRRYYYEDRDRHGNLRRYFRKRVGTTGKYRKVRLREPPGSAEFQEEFAAAMGAQKWTSPPLIFGIPWTPLSKTRGLIYFLAARDHIKIGFTTNLPKRIQSLQTSSSEKLSLIHAIEGYMADEASIHTQFSASRIIGEWFRPTPDLHDFIASKGGPHRGTAWEYME